MNEYIHTYMITGLHLLLLTLNRDNLPETEMLSNLKDLKWQAPSRSLYNSFMSNVRNVHLSEKLSLSVSVSVSISLSVIVEFSATQYLIMQAHHFIHI